MSNQWVYGQLPNALLPWYRESHRQLPWRGDPDPYHIWVSEIMLQQTRVEAVKGYYRRFLDALPTIQSLAQVDDALLHKLWEGLGYYSRVRNLKKAAIQIMEKHGGVFPNEYSQVLALPGIGVYTAGAICSIAFGQKTPAVDGNVLRVIARLTNDPTPIDLPGYKKQVNSSLEAVYPEDAGSFTQALMELGATICGPNREPDCERCPCKAFCQGYIHGTATQLPVKQPKRPRTLEEKTVLILACDGKYALRKRPSTGLLADLWEFPNVQGKLTAQAALVQTEAFGLKPRELVRQVERTHIFTHVQWDMRGFYIRTENSNGQFTWFTLDQLQKHAALPTAFRIFLDAFE